MAMWRIINPTSNRFFWIVVAVLMTAPLAAPLGLAAVEAPNPAFSPDIHVFLAPSLIADEDVAIDLAGGVARVVLGNLPASADVDAVHGLPGGDILFSLDTAVLLGGTLYRACDVIRYNGSGWAREFDCQGEGLPAGVNVDAVAMSGGSLLISLDIDTVIGGQFYSDSDIIAFNGSSFSKFLNAGSAGIDVSADVDALDVDDQGHVLVSFDTTGNLGGVNYSDEDVVSWNGASWSLAFDGSADDAAWVSADLDAWSMVFMNDLLFRDGFE